MVVFEDGLPKKDHYRRFNLETSDDTESIYEVLRRRLKYLSEEDSSEKFSYRPALLLSRSAGWIQRKKGVVGSQCVHALRNTDRGVCGNAPVAQ